jgi:hypothetical protein
VVMQAAELKISQGTLPELFPVPGMRIAAQVVLGKNVLEMSEIVFADLGAIIVEHVVHGGGRPAVIKGSPAVGQDQDERPVWSNYPLPFLERFDRIREMLEIMARQEELVASVGERLQVGSLDDEVAARWLRRVIYKRRLNVSFPHCGIRKNAVIESAHAAVDGEKRAKERAGPPDFQAGKAKHAFTKSGSGLQGALRDCG